MVGYYRDSQPLGSSGCKDTENSSPYIGLRLFEPDFENGHWYRHGPFSFKLEELTCFATLLGFGDESATEASGINVHYPQDFAKAIEIALSNGVTCGGGRYEGVESPRGPLPAYREAKVRKL